MPLRSVKRCLIKGVKRTTFRYEELATVGTFIAAGVEGTLNSHLSWHTTS